MKNTIRNIIIAAPLAASALTLAPASAMASEPGPAILVSPTQPKGPGDIAPAPKHTDPKGPQDKAPAPKPQDPKGPGDISSPKPCPTHGVDCTPDKDKPNGGGNGGGNGDSISVPTRIDAGLAAEETENGMELTWLLAGGVMVTATGAAFVARRKLRRAA